MSQPVKRNHVTAEVINFLEDYDIYCNPHGIEICYDGKRSVSIVAKWPSSIPDPTFYLDINVYGLSIENFINIFTIESVDDLKSIKPWLLSCLYEIGKAEISSIIICGDDCYSIDYRKFNNTIMVTDDEGSSHMVHGNLESYEDFKRHSFKHYGLNKLIKQAQK